MVGPQPFADALQTVRTRVEQVLSRTIIAKLIVTTLARSPVALRPSAAIVTNIGHAADAR